MDFKKPLSWIWQKSAPDETSEDTSAGSITEAPVDPPKVDSGSDGFSIAEELHLTGHFQECAQIQEEPEQDSSHEQSLEAQRTSEINQSNEEQMERARKMKEAIDKQFERERNERGMGLGR